MLLTEMANLNPKFAESQAVTRKTKIMDFLKGFVHSQGLNFLEPFKDFDTFGQGHLNRSHMKRALHVIRIGPGQRCHISEQDIDFLLEQFCDNGETINYKKLNGELMQGTRSHQICSCDCLSVGQSSSPAHRLSV